MLERSEEVAVAVPSYDELEYDVPVSVSVDVCV